jgi:hypothetical protein
MKWSLTVLIGSLVAVAIAAYYFMPVGASNGRLALTGVIAVIVGGVIGIVILCMVYTVRAALEQRNEVRQLAKELTPRTQKVKLIPEIRGDIATLRVSNDDSAIRKFSGRVNSLLGIPARVGVYQLVDSADSTEISVFGHDYGQFSIAQLHGKHAEY